MKMIEIPDSDRVVPRFENESDEADWWFENKDLIERDMAAALASGRNVLRYKVAPVLQNNMITLDPADEQVARELAAKRGETYEAFVQRVLHEALELEKTA